MSHSYIGKGLLGMQLQSVYCSHIINHKVVAEDETPLAMSSFLNCSQSNSS